MRCDKSQSFARGSCYCFTKCLGIVHPALCVEVHGNSSCQKHRRNDVTISSSGSHVFTISSVPAGVIACFYTPVVSYGRTEPFRIVNFVYAYGRCVQNGFIAFFQHSILAFMFAAFERPAQKYNVSLGDYECMCADHPELDGIVERINPRFSLFYTISILFVFFFRDQLRTSPL